MGKAVLQSRSICDVCAGLGIAFAEESLKGRVSVVVVTVRLCSLLCKSRVQSRGLRSSGAKSEVRLGRSDYCQSAVVVRVDRHRLQRVVLLGPIAGHNLSVCPSRKESLWADGKSSNNCWVLGWRRSRVNREGWWYWWYWWWWWEARFV